MPYLVGDKGYDADRLRRSLREAGAMPVIPGRRNRKHAIRYDKDRYRAGTSLRTPPARSTSIALDIDPLSASNVDPLYRR